MKHLLLTTITAVLLVGCGNTEADRASIDAAKDGNIEAVKQHLAAGADVNAKGKDGNTLLHYAIRGEYLEVVELLIATGADVNAKDEDGNTPLHEAAGAGHKEIVELLIKAGADIDAPDQDGASPLQRANKGGHKEIAKLLFDRVEDEIQKLIRNANTCYWVGLSEEGYCQLFRRGTNLLEKAKIKLAALPDVELSDKERLEVLQQRVIALTKDLVEQVEVTHDTSHGIFPLFRFYTGDFELYEWIDDPWVMASTRAGRSLTETILAHWKTLPQMDVCFTRRTPHESLPTKTPQGEDILPAPALQNELAVIFYQQSKFFIHNELAIARALNETEKRQFYDTGLDAKISQKLGKAWGIPGLLEVNIQVLDQYNKYWFYDARGRYMDCATGEEKQSLNAFGFTIDVRPATRIIILVFCGLLILSILPVFLMNLASPGNSASMKNRPPFFSRVRQHVETSSKYWGTSATPQLAGFFLGIAVPVVGLVSTVHFLPSPKVMIHYTLWSVMLVACLTGVVPILISTMLAKRFFHWEPGRSGLRAFWFLLSVGCGSAVLMAFASYSYLYPGEASIIMIQHVIFQFLMAGGFAVMFFSSGVDNDQSAREDYYLPIGLVGCSIASIGLLTGAYTYLPPEERIFMVFVYLAAFAVLVLTPLCHQIVVKRPSSVGLAVSLILLSIIWNTTSLTGLPGLLHWGLPGVVLALCPLVLVLVKRRENKRRADRGGGNELDWSNPKFVPTSKYEELTRIWSNFIGHQGAQPILISIEGEHGSGKTRLISEFRDRLSSEPDPIKVHEIKCPPVDIPFSTLISFFGPLHSEVAKGIIDLIPGGSLVKGLAQEEDAKETWRNRIVSSIKQSNCRCIIILDDAENMDLDSEGVFTAVFQHFLLNPLEHPWGLIMTGENLDQRRLHSVRSVDKRGIRLAGGMESSEARTFLTSSLDVGEIAADRMLELADIRLPLHLIEWVRTFQDVEGFLDVDGRKELSNPAGDFPVNPPETVKEAIRERLESVSGEIRDLLRCASCCMGDQFDYRAISAGTGRTENEVIQWLERAEVESLVRDEDEDKVFSFSNTIIREVLVQELTLSNGKPRQSKKEYIKRLAAFYSQQWEQNKSEVDLHRAVEHAFLAGDNIVLRRFEQVLQSAERHLSSGLHSSAWKTLKRCRAVLESSPDTHATMEWRLKLLELELTCKNNWDRDSEDLRRLVRDAEPLLGDMVNKDRDGQMLQLANQVALAYSNLGKFELCRKWCSRVIDVCGRNAYGPELLLEARHHHALSLLKEVQKREKNDPIRADYLARSDAEFSAAATEAKKLKPQPRELRQELAKLYNSWGECLNNLKRKEALDKIQESIKIKKQLVDRRGLAISYGTLGRYYCSKYADRITGHDKQKALKAFENNLEICEELFDDANACKMHSFIGATHLKAGEPREAVPHLEKSIRLAEVLESRVDESHARLSLGKALMKVNRREEAAVQVKKIQDLIQELEQEEQPQSALDFFRRGLDLLQASLNVPGGSRPNKETPSKTVARKKTPRKVAGKKAPAKKTPKKRARKAAKTAPKKAAKRKRT